MMNGGYNNPNPNPNTGLSTSMNGGYNNPNPNPNTGLSTSMNGGNPNSNPMLSLVQNSNRPISKKNKNFFFEKWEKTFFLKKN